MWSEMKQYQGKCGCMRYSKPCKYEVHMMIKLQGSACKEAFNEFA